MEILKVSSKSNPTSVAGALTNILKKDNCVDIQSIGAGALNQLVKSIIICRGYLTPMGNDVRCTPTFNDVTINDVKRTAIKMRITLI